MLFDIDSILYTDQVSAIRLHYDADTPKTYDLSVGDDPRWKTHLPQSRPTSKCSGTVWRSPSAALNCSELPQGIRAQLVLSGLNHQRIEAEA